MDYRSIGNSGLKVSELGIGGNSFGIRVDEPTSIKVINKALELGINFFDTSDGYAEGRSEEIIGKALHNRRQEAIIATKFGAPETNTKNAFWKPSIEKDVAARNRSVASKYNGGSRNNILKSVEASLKRLNTDYIDLYYIHGPDTVTPIEETLRAMNDLIQSGKVRYIGCSNFSAWQICEAALTAELHDLEPFIAIQSRYNLIDRVIEKEVAPCLQRYGLGFVPHGPLHGGFLTGKHRRGKEIASGTRLSNSRSTYHEALTDANFDKLEKLEALAKKHGHGVDELAIAWLLSHSWLSSVIAGVMDTDQLAANVSSVEWKLPAEVAEEASKITG